MALTAYTRTTWKSGDILTATKLNNMESQILSLTKVFIAENDADRYVASKNTWGIIKIANNDNFTIENGILNFQASPSFVNLTASGNISAANISASGNITITNNLIVTDKIIAAEAITLSLATTVSNTLTVTGATTLNGNLSATNASLSGTLGVTGVTTLQAVNANNIAVTNGITANQVTLSSALATYNTLDLIPEGRLENYVSTTLSNISITAGTGLTGGGTLASTRTISLSPATTSTLGGIQVGDNLTITNEGILSGNYQVATTSTNGLLSAADKTKLDALKLVATSGSYNDLTNLPTNVSTWQNDAGYLTPNTLASALESVDDNDQPLVPLATKIGAPDQTGAYFVRVIVGENDAKTVLWGSMPDMPTTAGTYQLQVTVENDTISYAWINGGEQNGGNNE